MLNFKAVSLSDYEEEARKRLPADALTFYASGSDGEVTLKENNISARRYRLRPRVLQNVSHVDTSSTILGHPVAFPICVSPSAWHKFAHINAEKETARGAAKAGVAMTVSSVSTVANKHITASNPDGLFFMQAYVMKNRRLQRLMLTNLKEYGFKAVVLSVDCPVISHRRKQFGAEMLGRIESEEMKVINYLQDDPDVKKAYKDGPKAFSNYFFNQVHDSSPVDPEFIRVIKSYSKLPVVVKGILTGKIARLAADHGADAVWVSNHGGRQLDFTPSTLDVLQEVVEAVKGTNTEVYVDSGFRTGTDAFKALALGAKTVFVGRPVLWGLAVKGSDGVCDVLRILQNELAQCMALCGCPNIASISRTHVVAENAYLGSKL